MSGMTLDDARTHVGKGWHGLLAEAFACLVDAEIVQVKEKWGQLTIYVQSHDDEEMLSALDDICMRSRTVCESCGAPASQTTDTGWRKTLCSTCMVRAGRY